MSGPLGVLFLCTGNSARSILAEAALNHLGAGRFQAYSAGSHPTGVVNPCALRVLDELRIPAVNLRSKSWDEFAVPGAPSLDLIITVCDNAAGEACPVWFGHPIAAHWGVPDPAAVAGDEHVRIDAFKRAHRVLEHRIRGLLALPLESMDRQQQVEALRRIGESLPHD